MSNLLEIFAQSAGFASPFALTLFLLAFWGQKRIKNYFDLELGKRLADHNKTLTESIEHFKHAFCPKIHAAML